MRRNERRWIQERGADCHEEAKTSIGSTSAYMWSHCVAEETIRRTLWLEAFAAEAIAAEPGLDSRLKAFLRGYAGRGPRADETLRVSVAVADLRGDGAKETLVYLRGEDSCGTGGCPLLVLARDGASFKVLSETSITRPPIRILPTRSHGWSDLGVNVEGGGATRAYVAKLPFVGPGYANNPTTPPASAAKGPLGTIVISADDPGEPLFY